MSVIRPATTCHVIGRLQNIGKSFSSISLIYAHGTPTLERLLYKQNNTVRPLSQRKFHVRVVEALVGYVDEDVPPIPVAGPQGDCEGTVLKSFPVQRLCINCFHKENQKVSRLRF